MRGKLIARGFPPSEIRLIQDHDSDNAKLQLFRDVRAGKVRILVGSTQKMGSGGNDMLARSRITGIGIDLVTACLAKLLYAELWLCLLALRWRHLLVPRGTVPAARRRQTPNIHLRKTNLLGISPTISPANKVPPRKF